MQKANSNHHGITSQTNIMLVDKGHQKLVEVHSHIKQLLNSGGNKNDLTDIFFSLSYFYENYLIQEEIFLKKTGYPNLNNHSASHKEFIKEIEGLKDSINKDAELVLQELNDFISAWLQDHEATYNDELVEYLRSKDLLTN